MHAAADDDDDLIVERERERWEEETGREGRRKKEKGERKSRIIRFSPRVRNPWSLYTCQDPRDSGQLITFDLHDLRPLGLLSHPLGFAVRLLHFW